MAERVVYVTDEVTGEKIPYRYPGPCWIWLGPPFTIEPDGTVRVLTDEQEDP